MEVRWEKEGTLARKVATSIGLSHKSMGERDVGKDGQENKWDVV